MKHVPVNLSDRSYTVQIGTGILHRTAELLADTPVSDRKRCAIITDDNVAKLHLDPLIASLTAAGIHANVFTIPAGESSKSMHQVASICSQMITENHDRQSYIIALGGGVVGDLAGFVAAIYYRGIPFVQIPTTIVSQVDSSVGGKTGVNAPEGKNLIGAFLQPATVIADVATLDTLGDREFNEGMAEAVKHAAIADPSLLDALLVLQRGDHPATEEIIARNVAIKARIVEADEKETTGTRAFLNFGHTIGHAIEAAAGYGNMFHGEAIALGIRAALFLSERNAGLDPAFSQKVLAALKHFNLPLVLKKKPEFSNESLTARLQRDKKSENGMPKFVLLKAPGTPVFGPELPHIQNIPPSEIEAAIDALRGE